MRPPPGDNSDRMASSAWIPGRNCSVLLLYLVSRSITLSDFNLIAVIVGRLPSRPSHTCKALVILMPRAGTPFFSLHKKMETPKFPRNFRDMFDEHPVRN